MTSIRTRIRAALPAAAALPLLTAILILPGCRRAANAVLPAPKIETKSFKRDLPGCGDKTKREEPCLTFSASWVEIKSGAPPEALAKINAAIEAFHHPVPDAPPTLEKEAEAFVAAYQKLKADYPETPQTWFDRRSTDTLLNDGKLLSILVGRKFYSGGPHAEESTRVVTFRLSDGAPVPLSEVLNPQEHEKFNRLAEKRLRLDRGFDPSMPLSEYAVVPGEQGYVKCNDIAALPKGLLLHFDPGVIGYPAVGSIDITLSWEEVAPTLRAGSPFAHLAGR